MLADIGSKIAAARKSSRTATISDGLLAMSAAALPWSTTMTGTLIWLWLASRGFVAQKIDYLELLRLVRRPICLWPAALGLLIFTGMVWSAAPWAECLKAAGAYFKLLMIPLVVYQFKRSDRGVYVLAAFLASCTSLLIASWLVAVYPGLTLRSSQQFFYGIPVKNYIDQSQEFVWCAAVCAWIAVERSKQPFITLGFAALSLTFVVNMLMINVARTSLLSILALLGFFVFSHTNARRAAAVGVISIVVLASTWQLSSNLHNKVDAAILQFNAYLTDREANNVGLRLEYWRRSLIFMARAPVFGNGTGAIHGLFEESAANQTGIAAEVISNPHNQVLNVGVQVGLVGIILLIGMWASHFVFFLRGVGIGAAIGLIGVVQNIISSLFNSHISDFTPGWMYVLCVGVAGGMELRRLAYGKFCSPAAPR